MKNRKIILLSLFIVWMILIACSVSNPLTPSATQTPYVITATPEIVEIPATETPLNHSPSITDTPAQHQPVVTVTQSDLVVTAESGSPLAVLISGDTKGVTEVFDITGNKLDDLATPGFSGREPGLIHGYTYMDQGVSIFSALYFSNDDKMMRQTSNSQTQDLVYIPYLTSMRGYAGTPYLLVGTGNFHDGGLETELTSYNFPQGVNPRIYNNTVSMVSRAYAPLYVIGNNGVPEGAWFTNEAYEYGLPIVFPVYYGLYRMDLATGNTNWLFNEEYRPMDISRDGSLVALSHIDSNGIGPVSIFELPEPWEIVTYALEEGQNLGSGFAVISPDNQKVAFMQAGGQIMTPPSTFHSRICYADIVANAVANCIPATDIVISSVENPQSMAKPLGWLTNHQLLFQTTTAHEPPPMLRILDVNTNQVTDFAAGRFAGFVY
ncbi:MAG: hypothetical protein JEZ00_17775 [Anaerolineaceae bacterium]|nr:hypothetical protein [Anaerolineaceae bacterium]